MPAKRHRMWSIVSNSITESIIHDFIADNPKMKICGAVHDQDDAPAHGHIFCFDPKTARTEETMHRKFNTPVIMEPFVAHPGESGPKQGKFGMARAARYLTHEHPDQIAQGKYRYPDDVVIANFNWRKEVDALNEYERVRSRSHGVNKRKIKAQLRQKVISGDISVVDAYDASVRVLGAEDAFNVAELLKLNRDGVSLDYARQLMAHPIKRQYSYEDFVVLTGGGKWYETETVYLTDDEVADFKQEHPDLTLVEDAYEYGPVDNPTYEQIQRAVTYGRIPLELLDRRPPQKSPQLEN